MKARQNRYLRHICDKVGDPDPHRAVALFVSEHRQPRESLESVCARFGISEIVRVKLPFEGGVFQTGDKAIIKLNAFSPPARQRFTLAHELAHLMLSPKAKKSAQRSLVASDLESACDAIAAELLMPLEEVRDLIGVPASVDALTQSARRFQVSLHAMAVRISELKIWKHSMGLWRWENGATELWFVGRRLWPTRKPYFNSFELAMQSDRTIKMSEHYTRLDGEHPALLEVRRLGENFLLAVILGM